MPCRPAWIDLNLPLCKSSENSDFILQNAIRNIENLCGNPCNFLQIRTSARNGLSYKEARFYAYFPYKTVIR